MKKSSSVPPPPRPRSGPHDLLGPALLLLTVWLLYGVLIQARNQRDFNLQQMGVEAIVEGGRFSVEGSPTPELQPRGDVFEYRGRLYAAKQPGQFMAGAAAYALLRPFGLRYRDRFTLTAALVTFLTASLVTAAAAVAVFLLARRLAAPGTSLAWPLGAALAFALGSTALPYAGIAHHDAIAAGFAMIAFAFLFRLTRAAGSPWTAGAAGLFLGLTVTTSMLPFFMVVGMGVYFLTLRRWRLVPGFLLGGALGLLPLLVYDAVNFGNPFLLPNIAGNFSDTYFALDWANFTEKARFYGRFLTLYAPVFWCGLAGIALLPHRFRREQWTLLGLTALLAGYLLNIDTVGHCQYGPRYFLPAMPFAALGLIGFSHLPPRNRRPAGAVLLLVGLFSTCVNLAGAMGGAMYCEIDVYAFPRYLTAMWQGRLPAFPLAPWLALPAIASLAGLVLWARAHWSGAVPARLPMRDVSETAVPCYTGGGGGRSGRYDGTAADDGSASRL